MDLKFVPREPDKAYISNQLLLPKAGIRAGAVKRSLEFVVPAQGGQVQLALWREGRNHIVCPREFIRPAQYPNYAFPFVDVRPQFEPVEFEDLVVPRDEEQQKAWAALALNDNGILNLACGKGKTKLAVKKIAQRGTPTLVVVPDGGILEQWKQAILGGDRSPVGLRFGGSLGLIQGQTFDWKHPVTLALITTLALRAKSGTLPEEMLRWFGQIIFDEVHQMGAPVFSLPVPHFYGDRIGLTATLEREDGLDPVYRFHIGEPFYSDLSQELVPRIYFQQTFTKIDMDKVKVNKQVNISVLRSVLGTDYESNMYRYWSIVEALKEGRKLLCLSHSKNQVRLFHSLFPGSGLIVAETDRQTRMDVLRNSQICFAIARLGSLGVDDDALDTLFWLTPFRSRISLQQSMGRIQRRRDGKKTPVMVVFEDNLTPPLRNLCGALKKNLREWGFKFDVIKPRDFPAVFPEEQKHGYNSACQDLGVDEAD